MARLKDQETPKSLSGLESLILPDLKKDFPEMNIDELKNIDLWQELIELTNKHNVKFNWVKGHNDNIENERCDKLANEAMDELKNRGRLSILR